MTFAFIALYRTTLYSFWCSFLLNKFGPDNFGRLFGLSLLVSHGLGACTVQPMITMAVLHSGGFGRANAIVGGVVGGVALAAVRVWRKAGT